MPISSLDALTWFRRWCRLRDKNSERTASATLFFVRQTVGSPGFPRVWDADG
jgi:hypothetical protein